MDYISISLGVALLIHGSLFLVLYSKRKQTVPRTFMLVILTVMLWTVSMFFYRISNYAQTLVWVKSLYISASVIPSIFYYFSFAFPFGDIISKRKQIIIVCINIIITILIIWPGLIIKDVVFRPGQEKIIIWGPLYILYVLHISGFFLAGFIVLWEKIRKAKGELRNQIIYIFLGDGLSALVGSGTNLFLVSFGYFNLNWLGQVASILMTAFITYAIVRHKLMDVKILSAQIFVFFLLIIYSLDSFVFTGNQIVSTNILILRVTGFFSILIFGVLLLKSVREEVVRREQMAILAESLSQANTRLQELDRQKTDFLSIAAHQLRTPLSIINGYIELLHDGAYGAVSNDAKEIFKNIDESNGHLVKLVDSFLDITRLEQGRTKYDFSSHDINEVISSAVKELNVRAKQKDLSLVWCQDPSLPKVIYDEEKIRHVVFNFIDNAIKYCEEGKIKIDAVNEGDGISIRVKDSGLGFDKIDEANFFQKFYRGNNVKGINVNGTGLGLFVCAKFIEAHHGRVWAHSDGLGKGSEFGFWIPVHQA